MRLTTTAPTAQRGDPRPATSRERFYYGWVLVGVLSLTVTVSYGVLMYAFPVLLAPMQEELGWSQAMLTGAYSLASLASGVAAIPIGRAVDRYGARVVMTMGSATATALLIAWSRAHHPAAYYATWLGLGVCMAAVFYEPAFAVAVRWFHRHRRRALATITVAGGLASTLFVPLTVWLATATGWRAAVVWLAVMLGVLTILPHGLLLRRRPEDLGLYTDGASAAAGDREATSAQQPGIDAADVFRSGGFRWLGAAYGLAGFANFAVAVHLISVLLERGYTLQFAGASLGALGLAKLAGRLSAAPLSERWSTRTATIILFSLQAAALVAFVVIPGPAGVLLLVALFGAGDGAGTVTRADIIAEYYGSAGYGRISGMLAFPLACARAAAPIAASAAYVAFGGYTAVLCILAGIAVVAAFAMSRANGHVARHERQHLSRHRSKRQELRPFGRSPVYIHEGIEHTPATRGR